MKESKIRADERAKIVAYLRCLSTVEIGTILDSREREFIGMTASWIENKLDAIWRREVAHRFNAAMLSKAAREVRGLITGEAVRTGDWVEVPGGEVFQLGSGREAVVANDNGIRRRRS